MDLSIPGQVLTALGTFAGIWVVFFLMRYFQHDMLDVVKGELHRERDLRLSAEKRADTAEMLADAERRLRIRHQLRSALLERLLAKNGISVPEGDIT